MRSGMCPQCGARAIYRGPGHAVLQRLGKFDALCLRPSSDDGFEGAMVEHYVCTICRYTESYITDETALENIAKTWTRVNSRTLSGRKVKRKRE